MCDFKSKPFGRDFRHHADHTFSHRSLPALTPRTHVLTNPANADAPSRHYANNRPTSSTDGRRRGVRLHDVTGFDPRDSNYVWNANDFSDSEITTSAEDHEPSTPVYLMASQLADQEDNLVRAVENHGLGHPSNMFTKERISYAEALKGDSKPLPLREISRQDSSTSFALTAVSNKQLAWCDVLDSTPSFTTHDGRPELIYKPRLMRDCDINLSIRPASRTNYMLRDASARDERTVRSTRQEISNATRMDSVQLHPLEAPYSTSCANDTIDLCGPPLEDTLPVSLPRHDSAMFNGPYANSHILPYGRAESTNIKQTSRASMYSSQPARTVKRHASEMSHDVSSEPPALRRVHGGSTATGELSHWNELLEGKTDCGGPGHELTHPGMEELRRRASSGHENPPSSAAGRPQVTQRNLARNTSESFAVNGGAIYCDCQAWLSEQPEECREVGQDGSIDPPSISYQPESPVVGDMDCRRRCLWGRNVLVCNKCWDQFPTEKLFEDHQAQEKMRAPQQRGPRGLAVPDLVVKRKKPKPAPIDQELLGALPGNFRSTNNANAASLDLRIANKELQTEIKHLIDLLQMSLPYVAEVKTTTAMALHECISRKLIDSTPKLEMVLPGSSTNGVTLAPTAPLTPDLNIQEIQRPSPDAALPPPVAINNYQNLNTPTPADRTVEPQFPVLESHGFQQMQYQHQTPATGQATHFAMHPLPLQPISHWQSAYELPTNPNTT
ncbi:hypothetical protein CERZMDRAFT_93346 [Cercospora zeae-maydis SCOH1-5]|uniref:Uncharacterized protein n=1 Tax=Cercospora zeae-maydis SCOH1-5 TaxID=717836 RepID=A0A6A6FUV7_9PEZI|nr:hypothetical protein CERZMDRAFT_93346 [Cercospora zeae-maydis SCOH1-5]